MHRTVLIKLVIGLRYSNWGENTIMNDREKRIEIVRNYIKKAASGFGGFVYGEFPKKRIDTAISNFGENIPVEQVLGFIDTTLFGKGTKGSLFTKDAVYYDNGYGGKGIFYYRDLRSKGYIPNAVLEGVYDRKYLSLLIYSLAFFDFKPAPSDEEKFKKIEIVKKYIQSIPDVSFMKTYVYGYIPEKIAMNAISTYAREIHPADILGIIDDTILKSGKEGTIFTENAVYFRSAEWDTGVVYFKELRERKPHSIYMYYGSTDYDLSVYDRLLCELAGITEKELSMMLYGESNEEKVESETSTITNSSTKSKDGLDFLEDNDESVNPNEIVFRKKYENFAESFDNNEGKIGD